MKILMLSNTPLSNAPDNLAQCLRTAGHEVSFYLHRKSNRNKVFVGGTLWNEVPLDELHEQFKKCDVIHYHNYTFELQIFKSHPFLVDVAKKKPSLVQYHSPRHSIESFEESIQSKRFKHAVIAQYHVREYPECEYIVPNVIPLHNPLYAVAEQKWKESMTCVGYTPSNTNGKDWNNKGHSFVAPILTRLDDEGRILKDICINTPYQECLKRKKWVHLGIDEVCTGSYHLSTLEFFAMEAACIVHCDEDTRYAISVVSPEGADKWPGIESDPDSLERQIRMWTGAREELEKRAKKSRKWMETYWSPELNAKRFKEVYDSL